jgi:hypothetical protein
MMPFAHPDNLYKGLMPKENLYKIDHSFWSEIDMFIILSQIAVPKEAKRAA